MRNITAIEVNTTPTRWISVLHKRFDGKLNAETTDNPNEAKDFGSREKAAQTIKLLLNPFDRKFSIKPLHVLQPQPLSSYSVNETGKLV